MPPVFSAASKEDSGRLARSLLDKRGRNNGASALHVPSAEEGVRAPCGGALSAAVTSVFRPPRHCG